MSRIYEIPDHIQKICEMASKFDSSIPDVVKDYLRSPLYQQIKAMEAMLPNYVSDISDNPIYKQLESINKFNLNSKLKILFHSNILKYIREDTSEDDDITEIKDIVKNIDDWIIENDLHNESLNDDERVKLHSLNDKAENEIANNDFKNFKMLKAALVMLLSTSGLSININYSDNSLSINQSINYVENQVIVNQVNDSVGNVCGGNEQKAAQLQDNANGAVTQTIGNSNHIGNLSGKNITITK